MVELKTRGELDAMREAGRVVAVVLDELRAHATIGTRLVELDELATEIIRHNGGKSSFLHYHPRFAPWPYPRTVCISVNDAIVHGIPDDYRIADGDLVSVDCGVELDGWNGDAATSFVVGKGKDRDVVLIETAENALRAGISAAVVNAKLGDISHAVETIGRAANYGIPYDFGGHGIGRKMHEDPEVPNSGRAGRGMRLRAGMALAIEPMFISGGRDDYRVSADGWTMRTGDGSRAAHVEHTVAITDDGPEILTLP
ncbi:MAG: type I methionyl aminopeptidase [Sciscionella sp.]|nr:type I methionyl aminopeptidase [Sciscionella sp.]